MKRFLSTLLMLLLTLPAHAQRPAVLDEGLTLTSPFIFNGAAVGTILGVPTTAGTIAPITVGNVLSGGLMFNAAGELVGTAPTTYYLVGVPEASGFVGTTCVAAGEPYYTASRVPFASASFSIPCAMTGTANVNFARFITPPNDPGALAFAAGNVQHLIYAYVSDPTAVVNVTVVAVRRALDGTETNALSITSPNFSNTTVAGIKLTGAKLAATAMGVDDRLVWLIRANRVSGPTSFTLTITSDGIGNRSTVATPMTGTGQIGPDYVINVVDRGATRSAKSCPDGVMTNGSAVLTSQCATFSAADADSLHPKTIEVSSANGIGSPPLLTTIASYQSAHQVTLAAPATADTGVQYLGGASIVQGGSTGSYLAGVDTVAIGTGGSGTTTGGTFTVQAVASVVSTVVRPTTETQPAITINSGGSGGINGSWIFTGTTGTGTKFRFQGDVVGGILVSADLRTGGLYTTNPTMTGEAVTSDAGVAGATVDIHGMDIQNLGVSAAGVYTVIPSEPAPTQVLTGAGSSSGATGAVVNPDWLSTGRFVWFGNDNQVFIDAINRAIAVDAGAGRTVIKVPAGLYGVTGTGWPIMTQPVRIEGDGADQTVIYFAEGYTGAAGLAWGNLLASSVVQSNFGPNTMISQQTRGAGANGLTLSGNSTATNVPDAIRIYDRVGGLYFDDLVCENMGSALRTGVVNTTTAAFMRESYIGRYRAQSCGTADRPTFWIDSVGPSAGSNFNLFDDLNIVFPTGSAFAITNHTTGVAPTAVKTMVVRKIRAERRNAQSGQTGDLVQLGSITDTNSVGYIRFISTHLVGPQAGSSAIALYGMTEETRPHDITVGGLRISGPSFGTGVTVNAGYNVYFDIDNLYARTTDFAFGSRSNNTITTTAGVGSTTSSVVLSTATAIDDYYNGGVLQVAIPASVTATISGTTLTVSAVGSGRLVVGSAILCTGCNAQQSITALGTGAGGTGTYTLASSNTLGSRTMTGSFVQGRAILDYVGSTRTVTIGALQGSSATLTYAPASGDAIRLGSLVEPAIFINGYGDQETYAYSFGLNAASIITAPVLAAGDPAGIGTILRRLYFPQGVQIGGTFPVNANDNCNPGDIRWKPGFIAVCTAANSWQRVAIGAW